MQDIKLSNFGMQSQNDDFIVEFEVASLNAELFNEIDKKIQNVDNQIQSLEDRIAVLNTDIDRLTNHADGLDYAVAVSSGIIAGIIDSVIVGEWDFKSAKAKSNEEINRQIEEYAEKVGCKGKTLEETIAKLEKKFKLPGDSEWNTKTQFIKFAKSKGFIPENVSGTYEDALKFMNENYPKEGGWGVVNTFISASSHHLDDFCHHPTLIGLICNVIVQFTGESIYVNSSSNMFNLPVTINDYGRFEGKNFISKIFSGIINWFLNVAETMANAKGHWMSDLAGSKQTAGGGAGLPGSFMSMMKELSALPIFKDTNFGVNLKKAYEKGIGTSEGQIDLGAFNALFEGANSKFDYRTENAIKIELKRQAMPVIINEVLVRGFYFIRRFINELKISKEKEFLYLPSYAESDYELPGSIENKVFDLASKLGLDGNSLKNTNYRQLLNLSEVIDKETYDILANEDFQINLRAPFVNTIIKDILLKTKREIAKTKIIQLAEQGYYHIFRFGNTPECKITLVNYLKDKSFKNVYVMGSDGDKLPNEIVLYLDACKADGTLNYDII